MMNIDMARFWSVLLNSCESTVCVGLLSLAIAFTYRRFRHSASDVPYVCRVAAAIAVIFGMTFVISGAAHSVAVGSLALRRTEEYGPLVILRFTTGAMLLYTGAMNIAMYRAIRVGRRWAISVGLATGLLFWWYLIFTLPLPGTGGSVPIALGLWTVYLIWLGAAGFVSRRRDRAAPPDMAMSGPAVWQR
jgi:hypothetical protein